MASRDVPANEVVPPVEPEQIQAYACTLFRAPSAFVHNTDFTPFAGGENDVYVLEAPHSLYLKDICVAVKVPRRVTPRDVALQCINREVRNLRDIQDSNAKTYFQKLIEAECNFENPLGRPFLVLDWVDGQQLDWNASIDDTKRWKLLLAIANASMALLEIQTPAAISAKHWITMKIDRKIERATNGTYTGGTLSECQQQKSYIDTFIIEEFFYRPYVLVHGDISPSNIIVGEDLNFKCLIDLNWSEVIPLQFAAVYPRFLTHEPVREGDHWDWLHKDSLRMEEDRRVYLNFIRQRAKAKGGLVQDYYKVISAPNEIRRYWWYEAASRRDVHMAMSSCGWNPPIAVHQQPQW